MAKTIKSHLLHIVFAAWNGFEGDKEGQLTQHTEAPEKLSTVAPNSYITA